MDSNDLKMTDDELRALVMQRVSNVLPNNTYAMVIAFVTNSTQKDGLIVHYGGGLNPNITVVNEAGRDGMLAVCDRIETMVDDAVHKMREQIRQINLSKTEKAAVPAAELPVEDGPMAVEAV